MYTTSFPLVSLIITYSSASTVSVIVIVAVAAVGDDCIMPASDRYVEPATSFITEPSIYVLPVDVYTGVLVPV